MHTAQYTLSMMAFQVAAAVAIAALSLSAIGPLADHHFAERHPGHDHIYLSPGAPNHAHPYQAAHSHSHGPPVSGGIVFLTAHDGAGQGYVDLAAPAISQSAIFPGFDDARFLFGVSPVETARQGTTVGPLKRPPRA